METPDQIIQLAEMRLKEANTLCDNKLYDGAFYLAGYSIELLLKAKLCDRFGIPNLFSEKKDGVEPFNGLSDLRKFVKTHSLNLLLVLAGLKHKLDIDKASNKNLARVVSLLINCWDEHARYKPCGHKDGKDVENLITLLSEQDGLFQWIKTN